ncbi:MAG: hypothetical protein KDB14_24935 [Planctomycetales bacterium]|nr:hypothetical protein [Planctomycetales bacterium]
MLAIAWAVAVVVPGFSRAVQAQQVITQPVPGQQFATSPPAPTGARSAPSANDITQPVPGRTPSPAPAAQPTSASRGEAMLHEAIRRLRLQPTFYAKLRHRVGVFGQQLSGAGEYYQQGHDEWTQLRMEVKLPVGDGIASLQHVCDGRHLWMRRQIGEQVELQRVDLRRVRAVIGAEWQTAWHADWQHVLVGGVPRLLSSVTEHFALSDPLRDALPMAGSDVMQVSAQQPTIWRIRGKIKRPLPPKGKDPTAAPTHVEVVLDANLLPYRVTYLTSAKTEQGVRLRPLVALEWYDIRLGDPIDPERFRYEAENYSNVTDSFIESLKLPEPGETPSK